MNEADAFQPVLVIAGQTPALWRVRSGDQPTASPLTDAEPSRDALAESTSGELALALFSDHRRAEDYGQTHFGSGAYRTSSPDPPAMVRILAACVRQGVSVAVLNPHGSTAGRAFDLKAILRQVRQQLKAGQPLRF
ncbi:hypothetical protein [Roseimaritima sediminicola]|uniref:hypothetical protein n=1 Tax=Roseimaritima sediminicola TaxID=2662066 RepID=UPI0012982BD2|nr:hypothetical protein [Roseimaritima sediminicola]